MAIVHDNSTSFGTATSATSRSWSHTCSADATVLIVSGWNPTLTTATYNGVSMTEIQSANSDRARQWYLCLPDSGSNTVVVNSSNSDSFTGGSMSLEGTQTNANVIGAKNTTTDSTSHTSTSTAITTTQPNSLNVDFLAFYTGGTATSGSASADGTNQTQRHEDAGTAGYDSLGSTQTTTTTGSYTMSWSWTGNSSLSNHLMVEITAGSLPFDDSSWAGYDEYTSDSTKVDEDNDNLIIDLSIHASADFWSNVASDGSDIRVTDSAGTTAYSFQLENFDSTAQTGIIFFNSQGLQTASDTVYRVYSGNGSATMPAASDILGSQNVWNINYFSVYHLNEDTGTTANDSTANNKNGTANNTRVLSGTSGKIGNSGDFTQGDDHIDTGIAADTEIGSSDFTIQTWGNASSLTNFSRFIQLGSPSSSGDNGWMLILDSNSPQQFAIFARPTTGGAGDTTLSSGVSPTLDQWYYLAATRSGNDAEIYVDGTLENSGSNADFSHSNFAELFLAAATNSSGYLDGKLDEVRILLTKLSSNWISTEHNNQSDNTNFWSVTSNFGTNVSLGVNTATLSAQSITVQGNANVSLGVNTATFSAQSIVVKGKANVSLGVNNATFSVQELTVEAGVKVVQLGVNTITLTAQSLDVSAGATIPLGVNTATFSAQSVTVKGNANVSLGVNTATFSVNSISVGLSQRVSLGVNTATFSQPSLTVGIINTPDVQTNIKPSASVENPKNKPHIQI